MSYPATEGSASALQDTGHENESPDLQCQFMPVDSEPAAFERLALMSPALIHRKAQRLRDRSRQCAELASSCVTEEAKGVLDSMAEDYHGEADKLDDTLFMIRRLYAEGFDGELPQERDVSHG